MSFEYSMIRDKIYIPECVEVHKKIFHLSDSDAFPANFFNMIIRKEHPLGIIIGCFKKEENKSELIGLTVTIADMQQKSLYCVLVGVLDEYQNGRHGFMFSQKVREAALPLGLTKLYGIYDPLEINLGKLYAFIGGITTKYIEEPLTLNSCELPVDKVLFEWDFNHMVRKDRVGNSKSFFEDSISNYKIVGNTNSAESEFLIEIPTDYLQLEKSNIEEAKKWRTFTRKILSHYLNNQGYIISDCLSGRINGAKKTYYLLSKRIKNELYSKYQYSTN